MICIDCWKPFKSWRCIKTSYYISEKRLDFLTTKRFGREILMKLLYQFMAILSPTSSHLQPLQVENCGSNSRLVADEDDNGKLQRVKKANVAHLIKNPNVDLILSREIVNEWGFRSPLCTYSLNWTKRTFWGWWDEWDDNSLRTQDSKFAPWRPGPSTLPFGHGRSFATAPGPRPTLMEIG